MKKKRIESSSTISQARAIVMVVAYGFAFMIGAVAPFVAHAAVSASSVTVDTINGQAPAIHCVAGDVTLVGHGTTGGSGGPYVLEIGWGDNATTTSSATPSIITSGSLTGGNQAFNFSASHHFTATSTGLTLFLHHSTASGNDSFSISVNQCLVPPTKGLVTVKKHVINNNGGTSLASAFNLHINSNNFAGSETGTDFQLFPGAYPVTEDANANYTQTSLVCTGDDSSNTTNGTVTIVAGHNYVCTVTNDDNIPVNHAPVANGQSVSTNEDVALPITLTGSDPDANPITFSLSGAIAPAHGIITLFNASAGTLTYTPNALFSGTDSFTFKVNDGSLDSSYATVSITVNHVNHTPVANDDAYNTNEDTDLSVSAAGVITNDTDVDGDTLTASLTRGPSNALSFVLNADGSFDYMPAVGYSGVDSFTYTVTDGTATSNTATVTINISHTNHAPTATPDSYSMNQGDTLTITAPGVLGNDTDSDGDTITAQLVGNVNDGQLTLNSDGSFTYTPLATFFGTDSFTYKANDGSLLSSTQTVTITVNHVNHAPVATDGSISTLSNTPVNGSVSATDVDGDTLMYATTSASMPVNGVVVFNTNGMFTYTPNAGFVGSDSFTFKANDGSLNSNDATTTIIVNPVAENTQQTCTDGLDNDGDGLIDLNDPDCAAFVPAPTPTPTPTPPPSSGGNGGGGGGGGNGPIFGSLGGGGNGPIFAGQVLGASTTTLPELPAGCSALLHTYMRMNKKNDTEEVKKLQQFLNDELSAGLPVNGVFGPMTDKWVRNFQSAHVPQILTPWGITDPTGYVYKTTQRWVNLTQCASLDIPMPELN